MDAKGNPNHKANPAALAAILLTFRLRTILRFADAEYNMENELLFFDTETTGKADFKAKLSAKHQPRIVQMGMLLCSSDGNEKLRLSFVIKPDGWTISKEASDIHGITTDKCEASGISIT